MRLWFLGLLAYASSTHAQSQQEVEAELADVRSRIAALQSELKDDLARKDDLEARLAETQRAISSSTNAVQQAQRDLDQKGARLQALELERSDLERQAEGHRDQLTKQAAITLASARRPAVQVLFSQKTPGELGRAMTYLKYLSQAQNQALAKANASLLRLGEVSREIDQEIAGIQSTQQARQQEIQRLTAQRAERTQLVSQLAARVVSTNEQLQTLEEDAQRLEGLLAELIAAFADIPDGIDQVDFTTLKGSLPWPVEGRIRHGFGQRRQAEWRWQGIVVSAPVGNTVSSIAYGRVAFADWLRGYGLLIIVDHGNEFHSLYGFNDAIYRDVGDWVGPGEPLAGVGASGGQSDPGLYFELRRKGQPVDPVGWLVKR